MVIEIFAMDSVVLRTQKLIERQGEAKSALAIAMAQVSLTHSMDKLEAAAKKVVAAVSKATCCARRWSSCGVCSSMSLST